MLLVFAAQMYAMLVLFRVLMQLCRVDYNRFTQLIVTLVEPVRRPFEMMLPLAGRLDVAGCLAAVAWLALVTVATHIYLWGGEFPGLGQVLVWGGLTALALALELMFVVILASVVLSWVAPVSQAAPIRVINQITGGLSAPVRRVLPPMGGLDFSPILLFLLISIAQRMLRPWLSDVPMQILGVG